MAKRRKTVVHMIGQAHLDPVWLWPWTEGRAEALATSRSAADRLRETPDFHFVRGEALVYEWIAQEDPTLLNEIRKHIADGRWHVVNGMVVQPDLNTPQGEAIVRQFLLGMASLEQITGKTPRVGYCVDTFGHPAALPMILRGCGLDSYVFLRPGPHEKELPAEVFWWEAPDGSRVLAHRIAGAYTTRNEDQTDHIAKALAAKPAASAHTMCFFGVGNHGGGPTRRQVAQVQTLAGARQDVEIRFSDPQSYFDAIRKEATVLPVVRDELQPHAVGCYSANSELKRAYRLAECRLLVAERLAVLASVWAAAPRRRSRLRALWRDLCFVQFHDTLCGTTTKEGADDALMALGRVTLGAQEITVDAGRAVAAAVDTAGPGSVVLFFNPGAERYDGYLEYEPWTEWAPWRAGWRLVDETGAAVPHQIVASHEALAGPDRGPNRLVFPVSLPPMGYRLYRFFRDEDAGLAPENPAQPVESPLWVSEDGLANEHLMVRLDPATGNIASCVLRETGQECAGPAGWNVPQVLDDSSDTWSHGVRRYEDVIGAFGAPRVSVVDRGPLQVSLLLERTYEDNTWLQQLLLRAGQPELIIRNWLHWRGQWRLLKLAFDVATDAPRALHDTPFAAVERPCDGHEVPTQMWLDVSGPASDGAGRVGLALINDGKYGCDVSGSTARLTILRSPPYAYHIPHPFGYKPRYDWLDQGLQEFTLVLKPHAGDWRAAGVVRRAREVNLAPVAITAHGHDGSLKPSASLLRLDAPDLEVTALKPAEAGRGAIVRLADRHGDGGAGYLQWAGRRFPLLLGPGEVRTFRLVSRGRRDVRCVPCDLLERPLGR